MKKLLMLSALAMVAAMPVAMAEGFGGGHEGGKGLRGSGGKGQQMLVMMFKRHDMNNDGIITKGEFLTVAEKRFVQVDADNNGEVTREEAKITLKKERKK